MGMFAKDKEFGVRPELYFGEDKEFVLIGARIAPEMAQTKLRTKDNPDGMAAVAILTGCSILDNGRLSRPMETRTFAGAIVDKVREADAEDFPAVVMLTRVQGRFRDNTLVIQFVAPWEGTAPSMTETEAPPAKKK